MSSWRPTRRWGATDQETDTAARLARRTRRGSRSSEGRDMTASRLAAAALVAAAALGVAPRVRGAEGALPCAVALREAGVANRVRATGREDGRRLGPCVEGARSRDRGRRRPPGRRGHALQRYAGTPVGEAVARNEVSSYELTEMQAMDPKARDIGKSPAESDQPPPPITNPNGGSSGGTSGAGTGR